MKQKLKIILSISPIIFALDQATKWLIVKRIPLGGRVVVWEHFFDIVHARNRGAAFGILSQWDSVYRDVFFYALSLAAIIFLLTYLKRISKDDLRTTIPIALILGGALGNIWDRAVRGSVVDFLSFHWYDKVVSWRLFGGSLEFSLVWPAFNVADSAITVGVFWLLIVMSIDQRRGSV